MSTTVLQGSVATWVNDGWIFSDFFIANLLLRVMVKEFCRPNTNAVVVVVVAATAVNVVAVAFYSGFCHRLYGVCVELLQKRRHF